LFLCFFFSATVITQAPPVPVCDLVISSAASTDSFVSITPLPAGKPADCIGLYSFSTTVYDECSQNSDRIYLNVNCTSPVARIKCHSVKVDYNFQTMSYPPIGLDGRDTYDALVPNTYLTYAWSATAPSICGDGINSCSFGTQQTAVVQPVRMGTQPVTLTVSNGCKTTTDQIQITATCNANPPIQAILPTNNFAFTYNPSIAGSNNGFLMGALSTAPNVITFNWQLTGHPPYPTIAGTNIQDPNFVPPTFSASLAQPLNQNVSFGPFFSAQGNGNQYSFSLTVDGGCTTSTVSATIAITCDTNIGITLQTISNPVWNYASHSWQGVTIDATQSTATSPMCPTCVINKQYSWQYVSGPSPPLIGSSTSGATTFTPTAQGLYTMSIAVHDVCVWKTQQFTINAVCPSWSITAAPPTDTVTNQNAFGFVRTLTTLTTAVVPLTFTWAVIQKPSSSQILHMPFFGQNYTFTPDFRGDYQIQVTATDGCSTQQATFTFSIGCPTGIALGGVQEYTLGWNDRQTFTLTAPNTNFGPIFVYSVCSFVLSSSLLAFISSFLFFPLLLSPSLHL
jgi:hypothetical protein